MIGSTFIHCAEPEALHTLGSVGIDAIDTFVRVEMDVMLTLDFEMLCRPNAVKWGASQPVIFDEAAGLAVFQVQKEALQFVVNHPLDGLHLEHQADLRRLQAFISEHGDDSIYELATF